MSMHINNNTLKAPAVFIIFLLLLNLIAHFLPFERASFAPDDYSLLQWMGTGGKSGALSYLLRYPDRPLNYLFLDLQYKITGDNPHKGLLFIFLASLFVLWIVFLLFKELFSNAYLAFLSSILFCLLPNKLEVYHAPIYANLCVIMGIYMLSLLFFLYYARTKKVMWLFLSLGTYVIGIFSYELGFFMPFVIFIYCILYGQKEAKKYAVYFIVPMLFYAAYRLTGGFGLFDAGTMSRKVGFSTGSLFELFHHYFGRYALRNVVYGIYKFPTMEFAWFIIVIDIILLFFLSRLLKGIVLEKPDRRLGIFAGIIFIFFIAPIMLYYSSGISSRHLVLPSIGFVIFLIWLLAKAGKSWKTVFLISVALALVISEGNAWAQVLACRINGSVYAALKERKGEICRADNVIIDTASFADNIPYTLVKNDFNILNTYYGAQAFEDWGLEAMVRLVCGSSRNPAVYIAKESPRVKAGGLLEFRVSEIVRYRAVSYKNISLLNKGALVVDFDSVFGRSFNNGVRRK